MDRGYDSEKMHQFISETLNAVSIIPTRSWEATEHIRGNFRKEMTDNFNSVRYRRRFLVETRFYLLKRRFGADLKSRIFQIRKKEISRKIILANLDRFFQLSGTRFSTEQKIRYTFTPHGDGYGVYRNGEIEGRTPNNNYEK
jgi:hypothetical protein